MYGAYTAVVRNGVNSYATVPFPLNGDPQTPSANAQFIQSSQGFFVQTLPGAADGSVVIDESAKAAGQTSLVNPFKLTADTDKKLWVNLMLKDSDTAATLADGVLARFDKSYTTAIDEDDVQKQANFNENFGIVSEASNLIVEARGDVRKQDTVQMKMWNMVVRNYELQIKTERFDTSLSLHAYLEDSYLKTRQPIDLSGNVTTAAFAVNKDSASYHSDRFRIVFDDSTRQVLPVTLTGIKATGQNGGVSVSWTVTNETNIRQYVVERSVDGGKSYQPLTTQKARNEAATAVTAYDAFDAAPQPGDNLYRVRTEATGGAISYTQAVNVTIAREAAQIEITLYPNPVREGKTNLVLKNVTAGSYAATVYSASGQRVYRKKITVAQSGAVQNETLTVGTLAQGNYHVSVTDSKGTSVFSGKLLIQP